METTKTDSEMLEEAEYCMRHIVYLVYSASKAVESGRSLKLTDKNAYRFLENFNRTVIKGCEKTSTIEASRRAALFSTPLAEIYARYLNGGRPAAYRKELAKLFGEEMTKILAIDSVKIKELGGPKTAALEMAGSLVSLRATQLRKYVKSFEEKLSAWDFWGVRFSSSLEELSKWISKNFS